MAASLNPDYYKSKINVFVALAPVASTEHLEIKSLRMAADHIHILEPLLTREFNYYNWFAPMTLGSEALDAACLVVSELCTDFASEMFDPEINNISRYEYGVSLFPSGQSYRAMVYYSQSIRGDYKFSQYDYGSIKNMKLYG